MLKELLKSGKEGGLGGIELVDGVVMSDEEWTPQNVSIFLFLLRISTMKLKGYFVGS